VLWLTDDARWNRPIKLFQRADVSRNAAGPIDMVRFSTFSAVAVVTISLAACSADGPNRADTGLGIGALTGGILGSTVGRGRGRVAATVVGAVIGGIVGSEIGRSLDERDRRLAIDAEYDALERGGSGQARIWRSDRDGTYGEIVPSRPYRRGEYDCRDYTHTIYVSGRPEVMRGTACRNPDGTWRAA
jgi:surface antigen